MEEKRKKYLLATKKKPVVVDIPRFKYFTINGNGNPNSAFFGKCIEALYAVSYAIRMSYKKGLQPENFYEYTVYPLEGIWDIFDKAKESFDGRIYQNE